MFTTEMDHDEILITVMDINAIYEDILIYIYDDIVYIKQWNTDLNRYETIRFSPLMFTEYMASMNQPEGIFCYAAGSESEGNTSPDF